MKFKPRKFKAKIDEFELDDFGASGLTFRVQSLTKGKIYYESVPQGLCTKESGVVIDDNGCWDYVGSDSFKKRFEEITH